MKYQFLFVLLFLNIMTFSCEKNRLGDVVDVGLNIYVSDSKGNDKLNQSTPTAYLLNDIRFEYERQEGTFLSVEEFPINKPMLTMINGKYCLQISPTIDQYLSIPNKCWVKIYWPDGSIDQIEYIVEKPSETVEVVSEVYVNNKLSWSAVNTEDKDSPRSIRIIKQ